MNKIHKKRIYFISLFIAGLALSASLILYALKQNINVFLTPSQINQAQIAQHFFRLGGVVKPGSVKRDEQGLGVEFIVADLKSEIPVRFEGILPDLFREGKGVVAEGKLNDKKIFLAKEVLAKHDENYMPKNVYRAMREKSA